MSHRFYNEDISATSFFPIHSLHRDFINGGQSPQQALKTIFKKLVKDGTYHDKKKHWVIRKEKGMSDEQAKARFFNLLAMEGYANGEARHMRNVWRSHEQVLAERLRKPDVILVQSGHENIERVNFRAMLTACEVKYSEKAELRKEAAFQLLEVAGWISAAQLPRRFFVGFTLCGRVLTLIHYARTVTVLSDELNIDKHPEDFLQILLGLTSSSAEWNGFDENFFLDPTKGLTLTIGNYSIEVTACPVFVSLSSQTKSTKVWLCKVVESARRQTRPSRWAILKDCWMEAHLTSDIDIHKMLVDRAPDRFANEEEAEVFGKNDKLSIHKGCHQFHATWDDKHNLRGIPIVLVSEVVACFNPGPSRSKKRKTKDSTDNILRRFGRCASTLVRQSRIHIRLVYETIGAPISWFSCRREFLTVVMGAVVGLFNGTRKRVLQCDASDTNVLIIVNDLEPGSVVPDWPRKGYMKRGGMLGDWGYAEDRDPSKVFPKQKGTMMGTFPFTAAELLSDHVQANENGIHEIHHDLESIFWLMWITTVNLEGPFNHRREWQSTTSTTDEPFLGNIRRPASPTPNVSGVPSWATPGLHKCSRGEVYEWKRAIPELLLASCMCSYWVDGKSGAPFLAGMEKLARHFRHTGRHDPITRKFVTGPPTEHITPLVFLNILHDMREGIQPEEDCPSDQQIQEGRDRYKKLLEGQTGLQVSILDPPETLIQSSQNRTTTRRAGQEGSNKRPPEVLDTQPCKRSRRDYPQEARTTGPTTENATSFFE